MIKNCLRCDKKLSEKQIKRNQYFCSYKCVGEYKKNKRIKRICKKCGKEFYLKNSMKNKFCSRECFNNNRIGIKKGIYKNCGICRKKFYVFHSKKDKVKYCSKKCFYIAITKGCKKNCLKCGKEFFVSPSLFNKRKYCSKKCEINSRIGIKKGVHKKCLNCNKLFYSFNSRKDFNNFCSKKCFDNFQKTDKYFRENIAKKISASNQGIPLEKWNGFSSFEPYTPEFNKAFKIAIKQRDGFLCLKCGMREEDSLILLKRKLCIHHIDYIKENTFPENCCVLCHRCNIEVNSNRSSWTKFFQSMLSERYGYEYTEKGEPIIKIEVKQDGN